jgi:hypothetical protein
MGTSVLFVRKCGGGGEVGLVAPEDGMLVAQPTSMAAAMIAMAARAAQNSLGNMHGHCIPLHRWGTTFLGVTSCCRDRSGDCTPSKRTKRSSFLWWITSRPHMVHLSEMIHSKTAVYRKIMLRC